jgi:hypothetical protein
MPIFHLGDNIIPQPAMPIPPTQTPPPPKQTKIIHLVMQQLSMKPIATLFLDDLAASPRTDLTSIEYLERPLFGEHE